MNARPVVMPMRPQAIAQERRGASGSRNKFLYPLMVIAAIAVTLFSTLGIAMMMGYLPSVSSAEKQVVAQPVATAQRPTASGPILRPANSNGGGRVQAGNLRN